MFNIGDICTLKKGEYSQDTYDYWGDFELISLNSNYKREKVWNIRLKNGSSHLLNVNCMEMVSPAVIPPMEDFL